MAGFKIVQITEEDKMELSELGGEALEAMHAFLECLDKVTDGQISQEMMERYGNRRGVPGTGRYGRRSMLGNRRGVPGSGRRGNYRRPESMEEMYEMDERDGGGYGSRGDYGYGNRYDY